MQPQQQAANHQPQSYNGYGPVHPQPQGQGYGYGQPHQPQPQPQGYGYGQPHHPEPQGYGNSQLQPQYQNQSPTPGQLLPQAQQLPTGGVVNYYGQPQHQHQPYNSAVVYPAVVGPSSITNTYDNHGPTP
eukprot:gene33400-44720_t